MTDNLIEPPQLVEAEEFLHNKVKDGKLTINEPDECSYCETCVDICPNECITIK